MQNSVNEYYDVFKRLAYVVLPGFAASYYIVSWFIDLPNVKNVIGICIVLSVLVSLFLALAGLRYDGAIVITTHPTGKRLFSLEIDKEPEEIEQMTAVLFKVVEIDYQDIEGLD